MFFWDLSPILQPNYRLMKAILSERNLVVVLFVMVLITFSLAQEDSKKMERMYPAANTNTASMLITAHLEATKAQAVAAATPE